MVLARFVTPYLKSSAPWQRAAIVVVIYTALAGLGLALIPAASYATPIFPASGFALAMLLVYGVEVLPAIWVASTIINVLLGLTAGQTALGSLPVALVTGLGAALQAYLGARLVTGSVGDRWQKLRDEKTVALFLLWGGLVACLVSPTVGVASLTLASSLPVSAVPMSWATWYVGDMLGVVVFAPLVLAIWGRDDPVWAARLRTTVVPTLAVVSLALLAFLVTARWENEAERQSLNRESEAVAQRVADRLAARLAAHRESLSQLRQFIETRPQASFDDFENFSADVLDRNPDLSALSINDRVFDRHRDDYERRIAALSPTKEFQIKQRINDKVVPAHKSPEYVPVRFIAPLKLNQRALGFDIFSEPVRRDAIEQALRTTNMAVTAPVQLVQDQAKRIGILEIMPFFDRAVSLPARTPAAIQGFAVAVVKLDQMIDLRAWGAMGSMLVFQLSDPNAVSERQLLYRSDAALGDNNLYPIEAAAWSRPIDFADRQWLLTVYAPSGMGTVSKIPSAWWVGIVGLLLSGMLQLMLLGMTGRSQELSDTHDQLAKLALYDPLTELPNRTLFFDRLRMDMLHARREDQKHALLFVDLDFFKSINDAHGHSAGDYVLREAARRMRANIREADTIGRIGGDEFVVLLHGIASGEAALHVARKLLAAIHEPIMWRGMRLNLSASIGLALFPDHGSDEDSLTSNADSAMYAAKAAGRNQVVLFSRPSSPELPHQ